MKIRGSVLFASILLLLFAFAFYQSMGWDKAARLFPQLIVSVGILLSGHLILRESLRPRQRERPHEEDPGKDSLKKTIKPEKGKVATESEIKMILWVLAYLGMVVFFGFWVAMAVFVPLFLSIFGRETWKLISAYTVGIWLGIYLIFSVAMKIPIYGGLLGLS